jgi:hypothetical protein
MNKFFYVFLITLWWHSAQAGSVWQDVPAHMARTSKSFPHRVLRVDSATLAKSLKAAPMEFSGLAHAQIILPMPDGQNQSFRVEESPVLSAELAAQYPEVKTYRVFGIDDPTASGRIGVASGVFHGLLYTSQGAVWIGSASADSDDSYLSYYKRDYVAANKSNASEFSCGVGADPDPDASPVAEFTWMARTEGARKNYKIAVAATGEYTAAVGGGDATTALNGANGIVAAINRVNEIYNRDLNIHLTLVSGTNVIYEVAGTDPYTNDNGVAMLSENQANLDIVIGSANYDIGHVFSTGGGGVAGLGVVCVDGSKGRGVTGLSNPVGDAFWVDFVAHEIGHQFRGNHTFNGSTANCSGNRNPGTAFEPGSGTTIMAYAGICAGENIQTNSDATFHGGSIAEITAFTTSGAGTCNTTSASTNTAPAVNAGSNYIIPSGTPFKLTGSATDVELDTLSYQWDEMDAGTATIASTLGTDRGDNALFRSFPPTAAGDERYLPLLSNLFAGTTTLGETLPLTSRTLNFRLTARDQNGGVDADDIQVAVDHAAGPFAVTQPNSAMTLDTAQQQVVEWNVACTDAGSVNCATVDIAISTDAGNTFSTLLAATPNDGSAAVTVAPSTAAAARFKVSCSSNIFFDIADADVVLANGSGAVLTATGASGGSCGSGDDIEPNGTLAESAAVTLPDTISGAVNTSGDLDDIYRFTAASTGTLTFTLDNFGTSDLDIYLLDSSGITINTSNSLSASSESFSHDLTQSAVHYMVVRGFFTGGSNQSYRLNIESTGGGNSGDGGGGGGQTTLIWVLLLLVFAVFRVPPQLAARSTRAHI